MTRQDMTGQRIGQNRGQDMGQGTGQDMTMPNREMLIKQVIVYHYDSIVKY